MKKRYVIKAPCKHGCDQHQPGEWRVSTYLPPGTRWWTARRALKRYAKRYHASGPYRLAKES